VVEINFWFAKRKQFVKVSFFLNKNVEFYDKNKSFDYFAV